jgi:CYTH domain-containing protein
MSEPDEIKYEDERRWLLTEGLPDTRGSWVEKVESIQRITQFYIPTVIGSLRYRCSSDVHTGKHTYTETYKAPKEFSRGAEHESEIPVWVYDIMYPNTIGETVKTRTTLTVDGWSFELDEFLNDCKGLVIVELEFRAHTEMEDGLVEALHNDYLAYVLPECFGRSMEITGDKSYSNQQLAIHGIPQSFYTYRSS